MLNRSCRFTVVMAFALALVAMMGLTACQSGGDGQQSQQQDQNHAPAGHLDRDGHYAEP